MYRLLDIQSDRTQVALVEAVLDDLGAGFSALITATEETVASESEPVSGPSTPVAAPDSEDSDHDDEAGIASMVRFLIGLGFLTYSFHILSYSLFLESERVGRRI